MMDRVPRDYHTMHLCGTDGSSSSTSGRAVQGGPDGGTVQIELIPLDCRRRLRVKSKAKDKYNSGTGQSWSSSSKSYKQRFLVVRKFRQVRSMSRLETRWRDEQPDRFGVKILDSFLSPCDGQAGGR